MVERLVLLQEDVADPIRLLGGEITWSTAERIRLNLRGGEINPDALHWLRGALRELGEDAKAPEFSVRGARFLPDETTSRLMVAGIGDGLESVETLRERVDEATRTLMEDEAGAWAPLIQLGRLRVESDPPTLAGVLRPFSETDFGQTTASHLILVATEVVRGAATSRLVERIPLRG